MYCDLGRNPLAPDMTEVSSSPLLRGASLAEELSYYKAQYEHLESELHEFQQSSRELEQELEKDIEASEKRERELRNTIETKGHEVEDWKTRHKQAKAEASAAHAQQEKEITTLRESNRELQLRLRDVEVMNDDFERQARHTTSSLEDLESKYNVAIERGVMLEEEIKHGEQERENFRIEVQRLKDELSDLRLENEITNEKLRLAERSLRHTRGIDSPAQVQSSPRPRSRCSEHSTPPTTVSSPTVSTPPPMSTKSEVSTVHTTPPSPPRNAIPVSTTKKQYGGLPNNATPMSARSRLPSKSMSNLPKFPQQIPAAVQQTPTTARAPPRHSRGPSRVSNGASLASARPASRTSTIRPRPSFGGANIVPPLPRSGSILKIQTLTQKMQKLEARVQSVRSRLPAPTASPPHVSPRGSTRGSPSFSGVTSPLTSNVTMRSARRRQSQGTTSSGDNGIASPPAPVSRLSFGPSTHRMGNASAATGPSRPSSRASTQSGYLYKRPSSRLSNAGIAETENPLSKSTMGSAIARPRSSMAGQYTFSNTNGSSSHHTPRQSISSTSRILPTEPPRSRTPGPGYYASHARTASLIDRNNVSPRAASSYTTHCQQQQQQDYAFSAITPSADRRKTLEKQSAIPTPSALRRRESGNLPVAIGGSSVVTGPAHPSLSRRVSKPLLMRRGTSTEDGLMRPPSSAG